MNELFEILSNLRTLRKESKNLSLEELQEGLEKFQRVVDETIEKQNELAEKNSEKEEKLAFYRELLKEEGITIEELLSQINLDGKSKRKTLPPKYEYTDQNGDHKTWTGQGRMPSVIQDAINNTGKTLDDFKINKL